MYWHEAKIVKCMKSKDEIVRKVVVEYKANKREKVIVQNMVVISDLKDNDTPP